MLHAQQGGSRQETQQCCGVGLRQQKLLFEPSNAGCEIVGHLKIRNKIKITPSLYALRRWPSEQCDPNVGAITQGPNTIIICIAFTPIRPTGCRPFLYQRPAFMD